MSNTSGLKKIPKTTLTGNTAELAGPRRHLAVVVVRALELNTTVWAQTGLTDRNLNKICQQLSLHG